MGEARRRRLAAATRTPAPEWRSESGLTWAEIEEIASEDPGDREDRLAHGFSYEDDWQDPTVLCRNGCGLPYSDVVAGKIRRCRAAE